MFQINTVISNIATVDNTGFNDNIVAINMIIEMIMSVILSVIIYGAILVLLRNKVILNVINNLKFRLRKK